MCTKDFGHTYWDEHFINRLSHDNNEIITEEDRRFTSKSGDIEIFHRCEKCISIEDQYLEKEKSVD